MPGVNVYGRRGSKVETGKQNEVAKDEDAASVIVALGLDVGVSHQEHREDDSDDIPSGEYEAKQVFSFKSVWVFSGMRLNVRECFGDFTHVLGIVPSRECDH